MFYQVRKGLQCPEHQIHIKKGQPDDFGIRDMTELVKILRPAKMRK